MVKNALTRNFNYDLDQRSPKMGELSRVEKRSDDGSIVVTYEPTDFDAVRASLGSVDDWSLNALRDAGVNPNFPIHTSAPTRMESVSTLHDLIARGEALLADLGAKPSEQPVNDNSNSE